MVAQRKLFARLPRKALTGLVLRAPEVYILCV